MKISWPKLIYSFLICEGAGILGSFFTISAIPTWYATLVKTSIAPPNWLFGPMWVALYALMAISLYLVWTSGSERKKKALIIFGIQLFLNAIWSPVFFGLQSPGLGLIIIILLWGSIIFTIWEFYKISKLASLILIPYLLWVSFATLLNYFIWQLNS